MMPALFIGHGSPMNALGENSFATYLAELGRGLSKPRAILAISAHWETPATLVLDAETPSTIHDFFGFPSELYLIKYPAPGAPALAARVGELLGADVRLSQNWGFDHGTWSVLRHLFPRADVPVTQLSLGQNLTFAQHYELARKLKPLRAEGILILASGNIVHNLREISWSADARPADWAVRFDAAIAQALIHRDLKLLTEFAGIDSALAKRAVPSAEHYLPLLYALGASDESPTFPFSEIQNGSIAMRSVRFG